MGCDIDCRDEDDLTAICYAAQGGHVETVRCLIEHGADTNPQFDDGIGMYPVSEALEGHHTETAKLLLEHMDLTTLPTDDNQKSVLFCAAAACGLEAFVERLIEHGYHPETKYYDDGEHDLFMNTKDASQQVCGQLHLDM